MGMEIGMWANIEYYGIPLDLLRCSYSVNRIQSVILRRGMLKYLGMSYQDIRNL